MTKFHDKLATQALETAIAEHARLIRNQSELQKARDELVSDIERIETDLDQLTDSRTGGAASLAEIEARTIEQGNTRAELQQQLDVARRKLRLVDASRTKTSLDLSLATTRVKESRATVAAAFERHVRKDIELAVRTLNTARAVWDEALDGAFDYVDWMHDLLLESRPTEAQYADARRLLRIDDE